MNKGTGIEDDFNYELQFMKFPFVHLFRERPAFLEILRGEFDKVAPRPKFPSYLRNFISDEAYQKGMSENHTGK